MEKERFLKTSSYFLSVIKHVLFVKEDGFCVEKPQDVSWEDVYQISSKQLYSSLIWYYTRTNGIQIEGEIAKKFQSDYEKSVFADINQIYAWEEIKEEFAAQNLKLLPLKGLNFKKLYPASELRQMGDLDILFEANEFSKVKACLEGLGYTYEQEDSELHCTFSRPPCVNLEMHNKLASDVSDFSKTISQPWSRAIATDEPCIYQFSSEDEYLYFLIHAYKHYVEGGLGVRIVTDFCLFWAKYKGQTDEKSVRDKIATADKEAKKRGLKNEPLKQFEQMLFSLYSAWYLEEIPRIDEISEHIISNGVFGRIENRWDTELKRYGKFGYLMRRLFPSYAFMKLTRPILRKLPFLLPFFWIGRLIKIAFTRRKRVAQELKYVKENSKK